MYHFHPLPSSEYFFPTPSLCYPLMSFSVFQVIIFWPIHTCAQCLLHLPHPSLQPHIKQVVNFFYFIFWAPLTLCIYHLLYTCLNITLWWQITTLLGMQREFEKLKDVRKNTHSNWCPFKSRLLRTHWALNSGTKVLICFTSSLYLYSIPPPCNFFLHIFL